MANSLNQVASENGTAITYDVQGNMTSDGRNTYTYGKSNRMTGASGTGMTASYTYDDGDRRMSKAVNGVVTDTLWSSFGEELAFTGTDTLHPQTFIIPGQGIDDIVGTADASGTVRYFIKDRLGSIIAATDASGVVVNDAVYSPYGELASGSVPTTALFGYAGRQYDPETGLYYNRARLYNPRLGQFMQTDPIGTDADNNLYRYAAGDPINATDPSGKDPDEIIVVGHRTQWPDWVPQSDYPHLSVDYWLNLSGYYGNLNAYSGGGGGGSGGGGPATSPVSPMGPQNNQPSNACSLARNGVYQLGGQLKSFGTASSVAGLGLGVLGLATSEGGGEVLLPGAVWFVRGGTAASALGAGLQTYAAGGRSPITSGAIAAVQTYAADFATGGLASSALRGVVGKEATEQFANAAGLIRDKLSEVEANCGAGK